jgi:hypothetical protein
MKRIIISVTGLHSAWSKVSQCLPRRNRGLVRA